MNNFILGPGRRLNKPKRRIGFWWVIPTIIGLVLGGMAAFGVASVLHVETQTCTVESKDLRMTGQGATAPRLYTEECGTMNITDVFPFHFEAGTVYGQLDEGETYELTTSGFRVPILSMFPSVVKVEPADA